MSGAVVVVGANVAGGTAAAVLREQGLDGRLVLIGAEDLPPYERPPLSKELLRGEQDLEAGLVRPPGWWEDQGIEMRLGTRARRLDAAAREVVLDDGERIAFDRAIVATGCRPRLLRARGAGLEGVWTLRRAGDAERIREAARAGGRAVLVGMGFVGAEVAASLRYLGMDVTVVEVFDTSLYRVLGAELGRTVEALHRDHGVEMIFKDTVSRVEGSGRAERVVTTNGRSIECSFVVVGIGAFPEVSVMSDVGVAVDGGLEVDARLQTAVPGVYAAGDVANADHPVLGHPLRVEHWDTAIQHGKVVAANLLGKETEHDALPYFFTDQYDFGMEYVGSPGPDGYDRVILRGDVPGKNFTAWWLNDDRVVAGMHANDWDAIDQVRRIVGNVVDPDQLADESVGLGEVKVS